MRRIAWLLGLALLLAPGLAPLSAKDAPKADIPAVLKVTGQPLAVDSGKLRGLVVGPEDSVHLYRGIPYAAPPTGERRWRPPQPPTAWEGVRECYEFGNAAPQKISPMVANFPGMSLGAPLSEDCLYLNVWAPANKGDAALPVMVWIHGGGYVFGAASQPLYEATDLARRGVVVVSMNYRLGPFGFFSHPQLSAESDHHASGNYGLLDQIEALRWVQRNIKAFGGDPNRVTIFGESAGGGSVFSLLTSPLAKGLFQRAIAESGPTLNFAALNKSHYGFKPAEEMGVEFATSCGAKPGPDQLSSLRTMSVDDIMKAVPAQESPREFTIREGLLRFAPVVDGWVIPDDPMTILARGEQNHVPLIVGANRDEGTMFMMLGKLPRRVEEWAEQMAKNFDAHADKLAAHYSVKGPSDIRKIATELMGDFVFVAPARFVARHMKNDGAPAYLYHFAHPPAGPTGRMLGAHHAAEIPYVLDNLDIVPGDVPTVDQQIRDTMSAYWVQFATTGNPNRDGLPEWPTYNPDTDRSLLIADDKIEATTNLRKPRLDAIDAFMDEWRQTSGVVK